MLQVARILFILESIGSHTRINGLFVLPCLRKLDDDLTVVAIVTVSQV